MSSSICAITPNPDISGIGVRTSIYAQAVLTLIQPLLASLDGHISADELVGLHELYLGILLPGCALLFSALIQARTFGLSVYHAIIVLNLSWINNTSALIFFEFALIAQLKLDKERDFRRTLGDTLVLLYDSLDLLMKDQSTPIDSQVLKVAMDRAGTIKSSLEMAIEEKKWEGSKEILESVIQGLQLLRLYGNGSMAGVEAKEFRDLVKKDKFRLPKVLGTPITRTRRRKVNRLAKALILARTSIGNKYAQVVNRVPGGGQVLALLQRDWIMVGLASAHLILFAGFGAWLWFKIDDFGINRECQPFTHVSLVVANVPVTSNGLRILFIIIYIISLLPVLNIVVFGGLEVGVIYGFQRFISLIYKPKGSTSPLHSPYILYQFIFLTFIVQAYFITSTELTIKNNEHIIDQNQEEDWTFGQTLAVALTIIPLIQVIKEIRKNLERWLETEENAEEEDTNE
ncbi:hypothetical protein CPB83DRAFT_857269 [Crepidotus variabilis]|uniref:Uncharacterized protein n=1 Tax=Crepidotus variabilis TaxID=179855 RepID=A0A9P6ED83_9AGAR|nr:hypothetical protein CPB83DRAFT_857269 [Crepidotus variabilis]